MGIAQNLVNIGRPVAFHPGIKKVAKTTNATLFLCQLLYWSDKTNGWIVKDSDDIRNETGLSYQEQRTARRILLKNGLIKENLMRLEHSVGFKVCMDVLNAKWEVVQDMPLDESLKVLFDREEIKEVALEDEPIIEDKQPSKVSKLVGQVIENPVTHEIEVIDKPFTHPSEYIKPQSKKEPPERRKIKEAINKKLGINPIGSKWEEFINFAYDRQINHGEPANKFLYWAKNNGFSPIYWTPQKMMVLYPQAFVTKKQAQESGFDESFAPVEEPVVEEEYIPMPDYFKPKYKLD